MMVKPDIELAEQFNVFLKVKGIEAEMDFIVKVVGMLKERATFLPDIWEQGYYFFEAPTNYNEKDASKRWKAGVPEMMAEIALFFESYSGEWEAVQTKEAFSAYVNEKGWGFGVVMNAFRICIVGASLGADLFEICEMIGKDQTIRRLKNAVEKIVL
jgi:glutamyl-tRNA synthetase